MKIGVLFDAMSALGPNPDGLILEAVEAVEGALATWGNEVVRIPVNPDGRWVERVRRAKFDLVFNLCEGIDGVAEFVPGGHSRVAERTSSALASRQSASLPLKMLPSASSSARWYAAPGLCSPASKRCTRGGTKF